MGKEQRSAGHAISRMPAKVQEEASRAIADGGTWKDVAAICSKHGFNGIKPQNVTNFRKGAHQEWLRKQERLDEARLNYEWKCSLLKKYTAEGGPAEAGLAAAMDVLEGALADVDAGDIKSIIADKPEAIFKVIDSLKSLRREMADIRKEEREVQATAKQDDRGNFGVGMTPEQIRDFEDKLNLM